MACPRSRSRPRRHGAASRRAQRVGDGRADRTRAGHESCREFAQRLPRRDGRQPVPAAGAAARAAGGRHRARPARAAPRREDRAGHDQPRDPRAAPAPGDGGDATGVRDRGARQQRASCATRRSWRELDLESAGRRRGRADERLDPARRAPAGVHPPDRSYDDLRRDPPAQPGRDATSVRCACSSATAAAAPSSRRISVEASRPAIRRRRALRAAAAEVRDRGAPEAAARIWSARSRAAAAGGARRHPARTGRCGAAGGRPEAIGHLREALAGDLATRCGSPPAMDFVPALAAPARSTRASAAGGLERATRGRRRPEAAMQIEGELVCIAQIDPATSGGVRERLARYKGRLRGETTAGGCCSRDGVRRRASPGPGAQMRPSSRSWRWPMAACCSSSYPPPRRTSCSRPDARGGRPRSSARAELSTLAVDHARARGSLLAFADATAPDGRCACGRGTSPTPRRRRAAAWKRRARLAARATDADRPACWRRCSSGGLSRPARRSSSSRGSTGSDGAAHRGPVALQPRPRAAGRRPSRRRAARLRTAARGTRARAGTLRVRSRVGGARPPAARRRTSARASSPTRSSRERAWGAPSALSFALRTAGLVTGGDEGLELLRAGGGGGRALAGTLRARPLAHRVRRRAAPRRRRARRARRCARRSSSPIAAAPGGRPHARARSSSRPARGRAASRSAASTR